MDRQVDILIPHYSGKGGTETVIAKIAAFFEGQPPSFRLHLVMSQGMDSYDWLQGYQDVEINDTTGSGKLMEYLSGIRYLAAYFRRTQASCIVCLNTNMIRVAAFFKKLYRRSFKIVSWIHFSIFHEAAVQTQYLSLADVHLAISSGIREQLLSLGIASEKIHLLYNPIERQQRTIPLANGRPVFVYIGRLMLGGQKNFRFLLENLARQTTRDWQLDVYGDGDETAAIRQSIQQLGLKERVFLHGWVANPWQHISEANGLLLTSDFEGFPMVLLEALSYGIPCLSSDCPTGPADIITKNNGCLYEVGNEKEFETGFNHFLDKNHYNHSKIKKTIENFYSDNYFTRFEHVFYKLMS